jgi:hypothetical protein
MAEVGRMNRRVGDRAHRLDDSIRERSERERRSDLCSQRRHDRSKRRVDRAELCRDILRLPLREVEVAREDLGLVLGRDDPGELDDARETELPFAQRAEDLGVALDELRRSLPVVRRALRESQLVNEEIEERAVAEIHPAPLAIELREGDEKICERPTLVTEEVGEARGLFACGRHGPRISRCVQASWNDRIRLLARDLEAPSRTPPTPSRRSQARPRCARSTLHARCTERERDPARSTSTSQLGAGDLS